ncbi:MAG: metal ABC transporter substrate-binding protein [Planctomycetota bacterium]|nr:metal ABC transporter substrate-binding protein [Planctomycetota bacterium]
MFDQRTYGIFTSCFLLAALSGCDRSNSTAPETAQTPSRIEVYTVNYPLKYFADRIAGDLVDVVFPVPSDQDPAYWKPNPDIVASFQQADLILLNGAAYAKWTEQVSLPWSRLLNTSQGLEDRHIEIEGAARHSHGPAGRHAHSGVAFTTWLDPTLAERQAQAIRDGLARLLPHHKDLLDLNFDALKRDLNDLDQQLSKATESVRVQPLLASHPVYQYLARRYDLNLKSVHWEPHEIPDEERWAELDELLANHAATRMIWEAPPDAAIVNTLHRRGIRCMVFHPCGNTPRAGDYMTVMRDNARRLNEG